ncbi:dihydrolipoyl dehydrogenase family protein [Peribacillus sp. SCS-155]|uniref:dihydrolipoyl dehydrogenase family protein n=1 Tax=Peribacillus sedimenti TaxID=3115297 RepID=UPI0039058B06
MVVGEIALERDLIIIGGGPGGYTAAIRAAQLGKEVTIIEKEELGGICLNRGCIPSKIVSYISAKLQDYKQASVFGFELGDIGFDYKKANLYKYTVIDNLHKGIKALCRQNKIEILKGTASFLANGRIGVEDGDDCAVYTFNSAIIATGGSLKPKVHVDRSLVLDAAALYELEDIPDSLIIHGSDYISIEAAFSFKALGSEVHLVIDKEEFPGLDISINKELFRQLKKQNIKIYKNMNLHDVIKKGQVISALFHSKNDNRITLEASYIFCQSVSEPNLTNIGVDRLGITLDGDGYIKVNSQCKTSLENVWAVGDVTGTPQLAAKAIRQGKVAAESICGIAAEYSGALLPIVIHSIPPIAYAGLTEDKAKSAGYEIKTGGLNIGSNGYASLTGQKDGIFKVISDKHTDLILGIHLYGRNAIELISTGILAMEMAGREEDLKFPIYPHPTINESLMEAVEALVSQAIHQPKTKTAVQK